MKTKICIKQSEAGERVDLFLTGKLTDSSRNRIAQSIKNGEILVNNQSIKPNYKLKTIPDVERNLEKLSDAGFDKVYIAVGYLGDKIKDRLGNGDKYNLALQYLEGGEGTGGALSPLKNIFTNSFVVFNNLESDIDLKKIIDFHSKHNSVATIATSDLEELNGLYVLEPEVFDFIPKDFSMLESDIFTKCLDFRR